MAGFDAERVSRTIAARACRSRRNRVGGQRFRRRLPGVAHTPARRGVFRSQPERIQIGDWRYEVARDGRLSAAHVVNGIVIAEEILLADAVGPHLARVARTGRRAIRRGDRPQYRGRSGRAGRQRGVNLFQGEQGLVDVTERVGRRLAGNGL